MDYRPEAWRPYGQSRGMSGNWARILADSRVAKEFLPSLREMTAVWHVNSYNLQSAGLDFEHKIMEKQVQLWSQFFRTSFAENKLVPPKWLKIEFAQEYQSRHQVWQTTFDEALESFKIEVEGQEEDLEASSRKWLDDMYGEGKQGKSGRQRRRARQAET